MIRFEQTLTILESIGFISGLSAIVFAWRYAIFKKSINQAYLLLTTKKIKQKEKLANFWFRPISLSYIKFRKKEIPVIIKSIRDLNKIDIKKFKTVLFLLNPKDKKYDLKKQLSVLKKLKKEKKVIPVVTKEYKDRILRVKKELGEIYILKKELEKEYHLVKVK